MAQDDQEINYFVRVHNTDLDGTKPVLISLTGIKGVGRHTAKFVAETAGVEKNVLMGKLDEASVDRIREVISNYVDRIPVWMTNRPKDLYTGAKRHLLGADVSMTVDDDINHLHSLQFECG